MCQAPCGGFGGARLNKMNLFRKSTWVAGTNMVPANAGRTNSKNRDSWPHPGPGTSPATDSSLEQKSLRSSMSSHVDRDEDKRRKEET